MQNLGLKLSFLARYLGTNLEFSALI